MRRVYPLQPEMINPTGFQIQNRNRNVQNRVEIPKTKPPNSTIEPGGESRVGSTLFRLRGSWNDRDILRQNSRISGRAGRPQSRHNQLRRPSIAKLRSKQPFPNLETPVWCDYFAIPKKFFRFRPVC